MKIMRNNELQEKSLIDPVGKFRVCEPQSLIDTDFEYGLQATKWETLELVNNIPTFFSRDNDESLALSNITVTTDSYNVYIHTLSNHNLTVGTPILVSGVNSFSAEGGFVVNGITSNNSFIYKAKSLQTQTGSIYDSISTNVYIGKLYQGTQYSLDALGYIRTNGENQILVDTVYPHGFSANTSFILSKSVGQKQLVISNSNIDTNDSFSFSNTVFTTSNNGESNVGYTINNIVVHDWESKITAYVDNSNVDPVTSIITCSNHGLLNNDNVMYVPALLTLSNIDAQYLEEDAARTPPITSSFFNISSPYSYSFDGGNLSMNTGGSNMFGAGSNNVHYFGSVTAPTTPIPYSTTNWTAWDNFTDYRTFGTVTPYTVVIRHTLAQTWYYKIDVANTAAQEGSIHERYGTISNSQNNMNYRWNAFGLYNNGTRPSFYYLVMNFQAAGAGNYPTNTLFTGTATTTISSLSYTYQIAQFGTYHPAHTIVMLLSRANGSRITQAELQSVVDNICNYFQTFTNIMGEYRLFNAHIYNYNNAGDYYINNGGNDMFDNNKLGNLLYIDNQLLSYRDRTFTSLTTNSHVEYKFISDCVPQIMVSRIFQSRSVQYRISDTWAVGSGTIASNYWLSLNTASWFCCWGYHSLHSRSSRASVHRIFMVWNYASSWPVVTMNTFSLSSTSTNINFAYTPPDNEYPGYCAVILLSQVNGAAVSQTYFEYIVQCVLANSQYTTLTNWPLTLVKNVNPSEYSMYNCIGNLSPEEVYQVNVINSHQFQLMDIPRLTNIYTYGASFSRYSNGNASITQYDIPIDITTNFINWRNLYDNRSFIRFFGNYYGYQHFEILLVDMSTGTEYTITSYTLGGGYYYGPYLYFNNLSSFGSITDPIRTYRIRVRGTSSGNYYPNDYLYLYYNDPIPAYCMSPLTRPIKPLTQGSTKEYISKHAFMKVYRIHSLSGVNAPNNVGYYFHFLRSASDPLTVQSSDDVYLFQHPDITGIELISRNSNSSRYYNLSNGLSGPSIPRWYLPSKDNFKEGNYSKYNIHTNTVNIQLVYTAARLNYQGNVQSGSDRDWWPGISWIVVGRDVQQKNSIFIKNHGIPTNTAIQIEDLNGKGIREIEEGIYFASPVNNDYIRLKASSGTTSTIDMTTYDGTIKLYYTIANPNKDSIYVPDHGLFEGTPLVYTADSNVLYPLVNTSTYYAFDVTKDRFGLSSNKTTKLNLGGTELYEDVSFASAIGTGAIISSAPNVTLAGSGNGTGTTGGFITVNGQKYLQFNGAGTREIISKALNLTDAVVLRIYVIRGSGTNGGDAPEAGEELYAAYSLNGSTWTDIGIISSTTSLPTWNIETITIPVAARVSTSYIKVYQKVQSGINNDNYGIQYIKIDAGVSLIPTDMHYLAVGGTGAVDGIYVSSFASQDSSMLTLTSPFNLPPKTIYVNPFKVVNIANNTLYIPLHNMKTGAVVKYQSNSNTAISPLVDNTDYYITRIDENQVRLATSYANSVNNVNITITSLGTGTDHIILDYSVGGELTSTYTVSAASGTNLVEGQVDGNGVTLTQFTSEFRVGNLMNIIVNSTNYDDFTVSSVDTGSYTITLNKTIPISAGTSGVPIVFAPSNPKLSTTAVNTGSLSPLIQGYIYYAVITGTTTLRLFNTYNDSLTSTNVIAISSGTGVFTIIAPSTVISRKITAIRNNKFIEVDTPYNVNITNMKYLLSSNLFVKADGFALHRPFDGGIELIPPKNSDSQMIRQTRKYFRYQSGKGIQVSLAINFSAPVDVDSLYRVGGTAYLKTKRPHRLSTGVNIRIEGSSESNWNGTFSITSIPDSTTMTFTLSILPSTLSAPGNMTFAVVNWTNSFIRGGLYDDQNGMYFEYDGTDLFCVRRSSVLQLSGTCLLTFNSPVVEGYNTKFLSQLTRNDMIVIKGQSYKVVSIQSDTRLYIQPVYRGITRDGCIITKTTEVRASKSQWTIDKCDGTGPTGYNLNINRIQMAYLDYSWYGAGKVRFGFKERNGDVRYVHEFIHNNFQNEAYLRSGNLPCRYEVVNRGFPTYVPALMHWGTSVIMDGRYDDDKAYLFTAAGQLLSYQGNDQITLTGNVASRNFSPIGGSFNSASYIYDSTTRNYVTAYAICTTFNNYDVVKNIRSGTPVTGTNIPSATITVSQPQRYNNNSYGTIIWISKPPTASYTVGNAVLGSSSDSIPNVIPLISIRLSPSVDNSRPGVLGAREIINRMQLILKTVGILTTHDCEIRLLLNGSIDNRSWQRVTPPSLSQLVYHGKNDTIDNGTQIFNFRIPGGSASSTNGKRTAIGTTYDIAELVTLGNAILGGDGIFPDGPDLLTIAASVLDLSDISSTSPFTITGRVTWTESQA
jgi:hypothetical protein